MFVLCQSHLRKQLLKQLHYLLAELEVLLVHLGGLRFQLQGEVIDAPYKGVSEEECLHETIHITGIIGILQSTGWGPVRHSF